MTTCVAVQQQLARATEQHYGLKHNCTAVSQVSLHTILIGVTGTIYTRHTDQFMSYP